MVTSIICLNFASDPLLPRILPPILRQVVFSNRGASQTGVLEPGSGTGEAACPVNPAQ